MKPTLPEPTIVSYQTDSAMRTMEVRSYPAYEVQRLIDEAYKAGQLSYTDEIPCPICDTGKASLEYEITTSSSGEVRPWFYRQCDFCGSEMRLNKKDDSL